MKIEDIQKAADEFADREYEYNYIDMNALSKGFYHGSKWRINSVWHDSNEKPVLNDFFVYQTDNGELETDCLLKDRWDLYVVSTKLIRWAYMKDLIPDKEE